MASRFFFNGRLHTTPIAVSAVDDTRMAPQNPAVGNNLALVGLSDAGEPNKLLTFSSPRDAARVLKGGELLTAVRKAFSPSPATGGPSKVTVVRVGNASQSTLMLKDSSGNDSILLTSQLYGLYANQIRVLIEAGSDFGKRVTTRVGADYYVADNLHRDAFTIRYSGAAASAHLTLTPAQVRLVTPAPSVVLSAAATVASGATITFTKTVVTQASTATRTVEISTNGLAVGMTVTGTNIAGGTTIAEIVDGSTLVLSATPTASVTAGTTLTFTTTGTTTASSTASTTLQLDASKVSAGMAVSGTGVEANTTVASVNGGAIVINLLDTPTVQALCDRINSYAGYTATPAAAGALLPTHRALDGEISQDIKSADLKVTATLQEIINWMNSAAEGFVTATRPLTAAEAPANLPYTFLTGATDPAPTNLDWVTAIDVLTGADVQHVVPLSASVAVHQAADAHVIFMSDAGRKERRAYVGPGLNLTVDAVKLLPHALGSDRTALVWPGHYDTDLVTGQRILLPPYMTAVHVAGGFAGLNPGNAMTNKPIRVAGLEVEPSFPADTDTLIENGVCTLESTPRGIKVCRSISTWLANDNFNRVEISCGIATDYLVRAVREALEPLVGNKASPQILARAAQVTESVLKSLARPEPGGPGVIVGDDNSPAYRNIVCEIEGDVLHVAFEASPVVPINFIALAVSIVPYRGTLAL